MNPQVGCSNHPGRASYIKDLANIGEVLFYRGVYIGVH
jgi:hypothetical protein